MEIGPQTRALVTGASLGIGRATATALAARARPLASSRGAEGLEALAGELGDRAIAVPADVSDREQIESATASFVERAGGLDLLVANAGVARYAPFFEQDPDDADLMVRTNVTGTINTVRAGLGPCSTAAAATSSSSAPGARLLGSGLRGHKAANKGFAEALRHELSGTGVSLSTIFPGEVATDLHAEAEQLPDWRNSEDAIPAEEVASAVLTAVEEDRREVHVPRQVRLLAINDVAPGLLDRLLAAVRGGSAAPRRY